MTITKEKHSDCIDIAPSWRQVIGECVARFSCQTIGRSARRQFAF